MRAPQTGAASARKIIGGAAVGDEHRLFDDLVRDSPPHAVDFDFAAGGDFDRVFGQFDLHRSFHRAKRAQRHASVAQAKQRAAQTFVVAVFGWRFLFHNVRGFVVGEAAARAHHAFEKAIADGLAVGAQVDFAADAKAVEIGLERADSVREFFRQHRQGAPGQINRIAAAGGFAVDRRLLGDIMRGVGDANDEAEFAARQRLAKNRVVKIVRVFAVDRDSDHSRMSRRWARSAGRTWSGIFSVSASTALGKRGCRFSSSRIASSTISDAESSRAGGLFAGLDLAGLGFAGLGTREELYSAACG